MSLSELAALARRHVLAITLVIIVSAGVSYGFEHTQPKYTETANIALELDHYSGSIYQYSLIATAQLLIIRIMGAQGQQEMRRAHVNGFTIALINSSNADDPRYHHPYLTASVTGSSAAATMMEFAAVMDITNKNLAALQANSDVPDSAEVRAWVLSNSGPVPQVGSKSRTFGALTVISLIAAFLFANLLDKYPIRSWFSKRHWAGDPAHVGEAKKSFLHVDVEGGRCWSWVCLSEC